MEARPWRKRSAVLTAALTVSASGLGILAQPALAETSSLSSGADRSTSMGSGTSLSSDRELKLPVLEPVQEEKTATETPERKTATETPAEKTATKTPVTEKTATDKTKTAVAAVTVSGRVAMGKTAVAGAVVTLTDSAGTSAVVKTDATGAFRFASSEKAALKAGAIKVQVSKVGMLTATRSITVVEGEAYAMAAISAEAPIAGVSGSVRIAGTKTAVAGATVTVVDGAGRVVVAKTNEKGAWSIASTEANPIAAGLLAVKVEASGYAVATKTVTAGADPVSVDVEMTKAAVAVSGAVRIAGTKTAIAGATVTVTDAKGVTATVKTDKAGVWAVASSEAAPLAPGALTVKVEAAGFAPVSRSVRAAAGTPVSADFEMTKAAVAVSGAVRIAGTKTAIAGATVTVTDAKGATATAKTDAKGAFAIRSTEAAPLAPGALTVKVAAPGYAAVTKTVEAGADPVSVDVEMTEAAVAVSGVVRAAGSKTAVAGATVTVTDAKGRVVTAKTDSRGGYSISSSEAAPLAPGALAVKVVAPGYVAVTKSVEAAAGTPVSVDVDMVKDAVAVSGVVRAAGSKAAIAGATVTLTDAKGATATVKTDAKGAWSFASSEAAALSPGMITVKVAAPGYAPATKSVEAGADPVTVDIDMTKAAVAVSGTVRDADTKAAIAGAKVTVTDAKGRSYAVAVDASGAWMFSASEAQPLEAGKVTVAASVAGYRTVSRTVTVEAGTALSVDLAPKFEAMTVSGQVTDTETGKVVAGAKVTVSDSAGIARVATTDAEGRWSVTTSREARMEAGKVTVAVEANRFAKAETSAEAAYGAAVVQDTGMDYLNVRITGQVKGPNNAALTGARVQITDSAGNTYTVTTDTAGEYEFVSNFSQPIEDGQVAMVVNANGYNEQVLSLSVGSEDVALVQNTAVMRATQARAAAQLPVTGTETTSLIAAGLGLLGAGVVLSRRRDDETVIGD